MLTHQKNHALHGLDALIGGFHFAYFLNCRSLTRASVLIDWFSNPWAIVGSLTMLVLQLLFKYAPVMNHLFRTAPIDTASWPRIGAVTVSGFVVVEIENWLRFGGRRGGHTLPERVRHP